MLFAQQVRNRAFLLGITALQSGAERRLAALGQPHALLLWRASRESPALVRTLAGHAGEVRSVAVSADGRLALSGSADRTVKVWDLTSGQELRTLAGHADGVNSVAVSADGRLALSASRRRHGQGLGPEQRSGAAHPRRPRGWGEFGGGECRRSPGLSPAHPTARSRSGT